MRGADGKDAISGLRGAGWRDDPSIDTRESWLGFSGMRVGEEHGKVASLFDMIVLLDGREGMSRL